MELVGNPEDRFSHNEAHFNIEFLSFCCCFLFSVREFQSVEYKFWNVHGDAIVSAVPKYLSDRQISIDDEEQGP